MHPYWSMMKLTMNLNTFARMKLKVLWAWSLEPQRVMASPAPLDFGEQPIEGSQAFAVCRGDVGPLGVVDEAST